VAALEQRVGRTDFRAGRGVALVAEDREKETAGVGEGALLDGLDPTAIDADRNVVLRLARDRARMTADAFPEIDGEPVVGHAGLRIYHARTDQKPQRHRDTETDQRSLARPTGVASRMPDRRTAKRKSLRPTTSSVVS